MPSLKETKDRHVFDKKLQDEAFNIVKDANHSLKDRAEAGLVSSLMLTIKIRYGSSTEEVITIFIRDIRVTGDQKMSFGS